MQAAEKLHISQPAISEQVSQLEAEIGFELFHRTGHGAEVTDLGRSFLVEAEEVYLGMLRLTETASQLRGAQSGGVRDAGAPAAEDVAGCRIVCGGNSRSPEVHRGDGGLSDVVVAGGCFPRTRE